MLELFIILYEIIRFKNIKMEILFYIENTLNKILA
jgi:hypothetical protein